MFSKNFPSKDQVLAFVVSLLVSGSLGIAIVDPNYRPEIADLTKIAVGAYMGLLIDKNK